MKNITGLLCALILLFTLTLFIGSGTEATTAVVASFNARYGPTLVERFSCELCHPPGSFSQLNSYGEDVASAIIDTGNCLEFYPPNTHTIALGRCEYLHAEGHFTPFSAGCTTCHGATLEGLIAPSCFQCHSRRWTEDGPAPTGDSDPKSFNNIDEAFAYIETMDSDGDGFSNIDEIKASSHPGNANITPGYSEIINASFFKNWRRSWFDVADEIKVTISSGQLTEIDLEQPIFLESSDGRLFLTQLAEMDDSLVIEVPRALLLTLFKDFTAVDKASINVVARNQFNQRISDSVDVKIGGNTNANILNNKVNIEPRTWDAKTDVRITLNDSKRQIDENAEITVIGPGGAKTLADVERQGTRVIGMLKADDALDVIGPGMENTNYTIVVTGPGNSGVALRTAFLAVSKVQAVPGDGGGGDDCLDFDPPGSHTVPEGECEYLHAPGADQPFANNCTICHGSDLRGSGIAPSCYTCHDAIWQTVPPSAPRVRK